MKNTLFILCCIFFSGIISAQETFTDKTTGQECLFIGSLSLDNKKAKVLENNAILWKDMDAMEQNGILDLPVFLDTIFTHNLQFELNGYEPFWHATLTPGGITYTDYETNESVTYPVKISMGHSLSSEPFFMFSSPSGNVSGLIYFNSLATGAQQYCEFDIPEDENRLYCSFLSIGGKAYKGCAAITAYQHPQSGNLAKDSTLFIIGYADDGAKLHPLKNPVRLIYTMPLLNYKFRRQKI